MTQSDKKYSWLKKIGVVTVILLIAYAGVHFYVKNRIYKSLENNSFFSTHIEYTNLDINILLRKIELREVSAKKPIQFNDQKLSFGSNKVIFSGISIGSLLSNKEFKLKRAVIDAPKIEIEKTENETSISEDANKRAILIDELYINNGSLNYRNPETSATILAIDGFSLSFKELEIPQKEKNNLFDYKEHQLDLQGLRYPLNSYYDLKAGKMTGGTKKTLINNLEITTNYNRSELSNISPLERDHISLKIPEIEMDSVYFSPSNPFKFSTSFVSIFSPELVMYRDKLLPDNTAYKSMPSTRLRNFAYGISVDSIAIVNGYLNYSERIDQEITPEELYFSQINGGLKNFNNTKSEELQISFESNLMGESNFEVNWSFEQPDKNDFFVAKARLYKFNTTSINPFLRTNLSAEVTGIINELYFTISGNGRQANGDIKMNYDDFKFKVLKKDLLGVNKVLTAVVNIFTNDGSKTDENGYRYGQIEVERDRTKSFFNYQWIAMKDGLLSTVTGDGKKED